MKNLFIRANLLSSPALFQVSFVVRACVCICLGFIHTVTPGSPAHSSHMQKGDLILLIDNYRCDYLPNIAL